MTVPYRSPDYRLIGFSAIQKDLKLIAVWKKDNLKPFLSLLVNRQAVVL